MRKRLLLSFVFCWNKSSFHSGPSSLVCINILEEVLVLQISRHSYSYWDMNSIQIIYRWNWNNKFSKILGIWTTTPTVWDIWESTTEHEVLSISKFKISVLWIFVCLGFVYAPIPHCKKIVDEESSPFSLFIFIISVSAKGQFK